ncbi:MAG: AAA family ATPase [Alphaproteobacteria bacterium]|nr:AAA family ATPase [Alphaproteobacteria bacterium]
MAIYSLSLGFLSRSEGRSSVGFSAYIGGGHQKDERTGVPYGYSSKKDVIVSRILTSEESPDWVKTSSILWNKVESFEDEVASLRFKGDSRDSVKHQKSLEAKEKFLNSTQTAQTIMGAIPVELSKEQAEACVEEFLKERFVSRSLVVEYAMHWEKGNPHFHGMITRRPLKAGTFSQRKDSEIVSKTEHNTTRKQWESVANKHLQLAGHSVRIDARSNEDRGSQFLATEHEGWYAQKLAREGGYSRIVADNEETLQKNIAIMCENPEVLIREVAHKRTTFTRKHIEDEIIRRVGGDLKLFALLKTKVDELSVSPKLILSQANDNIVYEGSTFATELNGLASKFTDQLLENKEISEKLGNNINREEVFTSTHYKEQEDTITTLADTLHKRQTKSVSQAFIDRSIGSQEVEFFKEQRDAVHHLCSGQDIRILNGKAGTGKTTLLKAVASSYQQAGYEVLGTSFQGKAVEIMEQEIGIPCKTLDSFMFQWEKYQKQRDYVKSGRLWGRPYLYAHNKMKALEKHRFTSNDVIIVDEANMVGGRLWEPFLREAVERGAKVLIVQDISQIKSRESGDYGRLFAERFECAETREVLRQKVEWQRECSKLLNEHNVLDGIKPYYEKGHFTWHESAREQIHALRDAYIKDYNTHQNHMVLAYRNVEVYELNQAIREGLKSRGYLKEHFRTLGQEYAICDRIRFTQNDHYGQYVQNVEEKSLLRSFFKKTSSTGIKNGTLGIIEEYDLNKALMTVRLERGRRVQFSTENYPHITHGYAMTIHKSEGSTFDKTFVVVDPCLDPSSLLVAMTRHRHDVKVYVSRDRFIDFKNFIDKVSRGSFKETLQDYQVDASQKPYLRRVQQYKDLMVEAINLREEMSLKPSQPLYLHPSYKAYKVCFEEKKRAAQSILDKWEEHTPYVRLAGIRRDVLEVDAGYRPRLLSEIEYRASIQMEGYVDLVRKARSLWTEISQTHPGVLSKSHPLFEDYKRLKTERDSIASVMQENPRLYCPFLRVEKGEDSLKDYWGSSLIQNDRVYIASIKTHAQAHLTSQLENLYYDRLSLQEKESYNVVKSYCDARNEAAALYSRLKDRPSVEAHVSKTFITQERFKKVKIMRDTLALKLVDTPERFEVFFEKLGVKEEKLLVHALNGEIRSKVEAYSRAKSIEDRGPQAIALRQVLKRPSDVRVAKQAGLDVNRVTFDSALYSKVQAGEISPKINPDLIYYPIEKYLRSSREAARLWKEVKTPANRNGVEEEWQSAVTARNENAQRLLGNKVAVSVLTRMRPGIETRLQKHLGYAERRHVPSTHVLEMARGRYRDIAIDLLGSPNARMSTKSSLRFGQKGSLVVNISGANEGLWKDFEHNEGGNIFKLIEREKGTGFKESVDYLGKLLNVEADLKISQLPLIQRQEQSQKQTEIDHAKDFEQRLEAVLELQMKSKPIESTVAESYLRDERGIQGSSSEDLRFIPKGTEFKYKGERKDLNHDCMAAFVRNEDGELKSVQLTKLDVKGKRVLSRDGEKLNKIQYGIAKGSFVTLQDAPKDFDRVFIAEGVETALSIKEAGVDGKIVASLGIYNIGNYQGSEKEIIICADNDDHKQNAQTQKFLEKIQSQFKEQQDRSVTIIKPSKSGQDFNDVLKEKGPQGVRDYMKACHDTKKSQVQEVHKPEIQLDATPRSKISSIEKIASYMEDKLKEIKLDQNSSLGEDARKDLSAYIQLFTKDDSLRKELNVHNPVLTMELKDYIAKQQEHVKSRGYDR